MTCRYTVALVNDVSLPFSTDYRLRVPLTGGRGFVSAAVFQKVHWHRLWVLARRTATDCTCTQKSRDKKDR